MDQVKKKIVRAFLCAFIVVFQLEVYIPVCIGQGSIRASPDECNPNAEVRGVKFAKTMIFRIKLGGNVWVWMCTKVGWIERSFFHC